MALPSLDSVPVSFISTEQKIKTLEMPDVIQLWLTNLIDTLNEALLEIDRRLTAGGL